ncbi:MAG: hypothetical protein ACO1SV_21670 [Fimbriimonas sp.]
MRIPNDPADVPKKIATAYERCLAEIAPQVEAGELAPVLEVRTYWKTFGSTAGLIATIGGCAMTTRLIIAVQLERERMWVFEPDKLAYSVDLRKVLEGNGGDWSEAVFWGRRWAGTDPWPDRRRAAQWRGTEIPEGE